MIFILASELFGSRWTQEECVISGITCDSRRIRHGYVFVCINGENDSGYRYVHEAAARGAEAIIADTAVNAQVPVLLYCNPRRKMAELAKKIYNAYDEKMLMLGVTGTNGKTTVTHLIRDIFNYEARKIALIGTNGCYFDKYPTDESFTTSTTPEAPELWKILKNMHELGAESAVMEVSSHALCMDRVYGMKFDIGVFTNLTQEHLDFHKNMENYFCAKEKLFEISRRCVINTDDKYGKRLYEKYRGKSLSVGFDDADITAFDVSYNEKGAEFKINDRGSIVNAKIAIPGKFSVSNALCAYGACVTAGIGQETICKALKETKGVKGRAELSETGMGFSVVIDYAHSPDGLENIISAVREICHRRVITLFGCGGNRDIKKRAEMGKISALMSDFTVITSDNPRFEDPVKIMKDIESGIKNISDNYIMIPDRFDAIGYALKMAEKDDIVILAGKGHEDYIIKNGKKIHFDEREAINYWLGEMKG